MMNGRGDTRSSDPNSVLEHRLTQLQALVRQRQKDWTAALAAASAHQDNLSEIVSGERKARVALEQELVRRQAQYDTDIARARAVRAMVDEQIREAALEVERARRAEASAAAAVERLARAEADAVSRLAERDAQFATELSTITSIRDGLEQQLSGVESALAAARHSHALAVKEVERLTRREAELVARSADEAATRATLERRIADEEAALSKASERISRERHAAAEQQAAYQAHIQREIATRRGVEETLAAARAAHAEAGKRHEAAMADAAAVLAKREAQFETGLASITVARDTLEQQLRDVEATLTHETGIRESLEDAISDLSAAAAAAEQRFREETATLVDNAQAERLRLEGEIARERHDHEIKRADEQEQHRSALTDAATRFAEREAELAAELSSITATRGSLEQQLHDVRTTLIRETGTRESLERAISDLRSAAAAAEQRFREETATLAENARAERDRLEDQISTGRAQAAEREATYQAHIQQEIATRRSVEETLAAARDAHAEAVKRHESAMAAAAAVLAEREAQLETELTSIAETRDGLERRLRDVEARLTQQTLSRQRLEQAIEEQRSAAAAAEQRFRDETATIGENARTERVRLEEEIARERHDHEIQRADKQEQHRSALADAAARFAERETELAAELASITATRDSLEQQLHDVRTTLIRETGTRESLEQAISELRSAAAAAEQRFREESATLAESARAERVRLEGEKADAATRFAEREAELAAELLSIAATRDSLEQQLHDVEATLTHETGTRQSLEQTINDLRLAAAAAERRFREETDTLAENARAERLRLEGEIARGRHDHQIQRADEQEQHQSALADAATRLAEREAELAAELSSIAATRDRLEQQLHDVRTTLIRETGTRESLERAISDLRSAAAAAEQRFRQESATLAENARAERDRLEDQISTGRAQAAEREATYQARIDQEIATRRRVEETLAEAAAARSALERRVASTEGELRDALEQHRSTMATAAARLAERDAHVQAQERALEAGERARAELRTEVRRQFEQSPVALCRCTRDGALSDANQAFAVLVGCRTSDELRDAQLAASLFEAPDDLSWLIQASVRTRRKESVETSCRRKDGSRVAVRLTAGPSPSGLIEIAAEDLTPVRVLEDRLKEAHRMEAVGRLASEIAVTCSKLLREIHQDAQRWLQALTGSAAQRNDAEGLLADVTRVSSFLEQVVSYGHEQRAARTPVDLNRVLRNLEPVLKQVAGDGVALELRKTSSPITVDVKADRVERLLVNVASYGRERMPFGGRLTIEVSTVVVDRKFTAQYPNVRQGPHALITVTEVARAADVERPLRTPGSNSRASEDVSGRPGVELGVLQELITDCGGHLWITAEPGGSMVVKMRLPLRAAWDGQASRHRILRRVADV